MHTPVYVVCACVCLGFISNLTGCLCVSDDIWLLWFILLSNKAPYRKTGPSPLHFEEYLDGVSLYPHVVRNLYCNTHEFRIVWQFIYKNTDSIFTDSHLHTHAHKRARAHAHDHPDIKRFERKSTYPTKQIQWQKNEASWQLSESKRAWKIWSNVYWFIVHVGFSWVRCFETHITFVE